MKIRLLSVGRPRDSLSSSLHDRYAERIRRFGVAYVDEHVDETRPGGRYSDDHVREREAKRLLQRVESRDRIEVTAQLDGPQDEDCATGTTIRLDDAIGDRTIVDTVSGSEWWFDGEVLLERVGGEEPVRRIEE